MFIRIALIAVIFSSTVYCSSDYYRGDSLVQEGVYAFYNYDFDRAVSILSQAREEYPDHPGVHLIWAASRWVKSQATSTVKETYSILEKDLIEIQSIYEELVLKYKYDPNYRLYQGSAIGLTARVSLGRKEWLKTLYRAYKGFTIIEDVSDNAPEIIDSMLPIGIIEYYAGISNVILKWAVKIYGLEASTESGLEKIAIAADRGQWSWIEAKAILCNLYLWVENDPLLSFEHSRDLVKHFPNNYYFNLLYFESLIRTGKITESSLILEDMDIILSSLTNRQREWYTPYQNYEKALSSFYKGDFTKTLSLLDQAINQYTGELDIVLGNAYLLQGMVHDKLYRRNNARKSYNKCIELNNFSSAMNTAKKYLDHPYSGD